MTESAIARFLSTTGALLGCALLAACGPTEADLAEHLERGKEYAENSQWNEAAIELKNALQIDPNHAGAHFELSQVYLKSGKPKEGFWELRETVRLDPSMHDARIQFAQIAIFAGEVEEALGHADAVLEAEPDRVDASLVKAQAHEALKQIEEAEAAFRQAAKKGVDDAGPHLMLAAFLRRQGERAEAEEEIERAIEVDPTPTNWFALAGFLREDGRVEAAEGAYRSGLEGAEGEDLTKGYDLLGGMLFAESRVDEAIALLEEGIERSEDPVPLYYHLARLHRAQGDVQKADEVAARAAEIDPDDPGPWLVLSSYRSQIGDMEGALEAAEKAAAVAPEEDPSAKLRMAEASIELGTAKKEPERIERGREILEEVAQRDPDDPALLFVRAKLELTERRFEDAIQSIRRAIDRRPDWAQAHFLLGTALAMSGQRTAARTELARALELDGTLSEARRTLVDVHAALGEHEYAVEEGRRYLIQFPDAAPVRIRVAQSLMLLGRPEAALAEVQAIEAEGDADVEFAMGRIQLALRDLPSARKHMEQALAKRPGTPEIIESLLDLDRVEGRLPESVTRIEAAVAEDPENARLQQVVAKLAMVQGDRDMAEAALKRAVELEPEVISSYRQLARLYSGTGRTQQTIDTYEKALAVKPDQPQVHHFLGVLYEHGGQVDRAIEHYEQAIRYEPNLGEAKNNLAYIFAESGENLDRALDLAQEAKALMPDNPSAADTLGWVLYRRGVPSAAIGYLKEAAAGFPPGDPNLGLVRHHLALAYEAAGDAENARKTVDGAIEAYATQAAATREAGGKPADPDWLEDAKAMQARL